MVSCLQNCAVVARLQLALGTELQTLLAQAPHLKRARDGAMPGDDQVRESEATASASSVLGPQTLTVPCAWAQQQLPLAQSWQTGH